MYFPCQFSFALAFICGSIFLFAGRADSRIQFNPNQDLPCSLAAGFLRVCNLCKGADRPWRISTVTPRFNKTLAVRLAWVVPGACFIEPHP
jgi:hypothetical protein